MTKKEKEDLVALYLFTKMTVPFILHSVKCSEKFIEEVRAKTDLTICPACHGSEHVQCKGTSAMEPCYCRIRRLDEKYFKPLQPFWHQKDIIPEQGLPDYTQYLHRISDGNLTALQVRFLFSYMLQDSGRPKYKYFTIFDLDDIQFGKHEEYQSLASLKFPLILVNAAIGNSYYHYLDIILMKLLFICENRNIPVWVYVPTETFPKVRNYYKIENIPHLITKQDFPQTPHKPNQPSTSTVR